MHNFDHGNEPHITTRWRFYPRIGWRQYGLYCTHCNKRANQWADNVDIRLEHIKVCKRTNKQLKVREGCYSWFNSKYGGYHQNINS